MARRPRKPETGALGRDPFASSDEILAETFYRPGDHAAPPAAESPGLAPPSAERPGREPTWRVISISLYPEDIERMDELVAELRRLGHRRANRSQLIRHALTLVDPARVPPGG